ncbi:MAG: hypothetical protein U1D55_00180 [Phycisphaerae bacterium]
MADFRLSEQVNLPGSLPAPEALLDQITSGGGIEQHLASISVPKATQERIRNLLIEGR